MVLCLLLLVLLILLLLLLPPVQLPTTAYHPSIEALGSLYLLFDDLVRLSRFSYTHPTAAVAIAGTSVVFLLLHRP